MSLLITVVIYNRLYTIEKWHKVWSKMVKPQETKLAIIHNYDGDKPPKDQRDLILAVNPDFYISRPNIGGDLGALQDVANGVYLNYEWDTLAWFVDDFLPMKRDFLLPFIDKIQLMQVGLVGACYEPKNEFNKNGHFRTVGFVIKRSVLSKLEFPSSPMKTRANCFEMEHGDNNITIQVEKLGFSAIPAIGNEFPKAGYSHWPNNSNWMWDCELLKHLDLMDEFDKEFTNEPNDTFASRM